jgi:hypothetical protein
MQHAAAGSTRQLLTLPGFRRVTAPIVAEQGTGMSGGDRPGRIDAQPTCSREQARRLQPDEPCRGLPDSRSRCVVSCMAAAVP